MRLINADEAIKDLEDSLLGTKELIGMYETLISKLKELNQGTGINQKLIDAGFTEDQINKFVDIFTE